MESHGDGTAQGARSSCVHVLHGRAKYDVPLCDALGDLRREIEQAAGIAAGMQTLLVKGKKVPPSMGDETPVSELKIKAGTTLMLTGTHAAAPGPPDAVSGLLADVRKIGRSLESYEEDLDSTKAKITELTRGFLDEDKTLSAVERMRVECKVLEENLMRAVLAADALVVDGSSVLDSGMDARWRAERKGVVRRAQAALREVDHLQQRLDEIVRDEFGQMAHNRGKPS